MQMYSLAQLIKSIPQGDSFATVTPSNGIVINLYKSKYFSVNSEWIIETINISEEPEDSLIAPDSYIILIYPVTHEIEALYLSFDIPANRLTPGFDGRLITVNGVMTISNECLTRLDNLGIQLSYIKAVRTTNDVAPGLIARVCPSTLLVDVIDELNIPIHNYFEYGFMITNAHSKTLYKDQTTKYYDEINKKNIDIDYIIDFLSTKPFQPNLKYATNCGY
jgi:hypothetical protein